MSETFSFEATRSVCDFIAGFRIDSASALLLDRAKDLLADTVGVTIAARNDETAHIAGTLEAHGPGANVFTLIGSGSTASPSFAAYFNGTLAHALEFDDSTLNPVGHPSCVIVPALFALGETTNASGRALLEAYLVGLEVHSRLGQAEGAEWSAGNFWLPIGHLSLMGATAACAKLTKLDGRAIRHALGLAAHACGGLSI